MYLSGEQNNSGTSVFLYNKTKDTTTHWYHDGFITPPEKDCLLIWHNGTDHFNWIKPKGDSKLSFGKEKKQTVLRFHSNPRSTYAKATKGSKHITVGNGRKKRKVNTSMSPVLSPDSSTHFTENKTSSLSIKTVEELKKDQLQSLIE